VVMTDLPPVQYRRELMPPAAIQPWLDRPDALKEIDRRLKKGELDFSQAAELRQWHRDGYLVFEGLFDASLAERINADVRAILEAHRDLPIDQLKRKFENAYHESEATREAVCLAPLLPKLDLLLGSEARPHQTLNLPYSSQQATHSDEILFTTHPPGYMVAAWFALEDITPDSGPLKFYPGSHRLPYVGSREIDIPLGASEEEAGRLYDERYYDRIAEVVETHGLEPQAFLGKAGDVLVWHSNLLHGAHFTTRAEATRQSLIVHYFAEGVLIYSDLWQRACEDPGLRRTG